MAEPRDIVISTVPVFGPVSLSALRALSMHEVNVHVRSRLGALCGAAPNPDLVAAMFDAESVPSMLRSYPPELRHISTLNAARGAHTDNELRERLAMMLLCRAVANTPGQAWFLTAEHALMEYRGGTRAPEHVQLLERFLSGCGDLLAPTTALERQVHALRGAFTPSATC